MPIDKLVIRSSQLRKHIHEYAIENGKPNKYYLRELDLRKSPWKLSAYLHCQGFRDKTHKLSLIDCARLGKTASQQIVDQVFKGSSSAKIYRIDACVDIIGFSPWDVARHCRSHRSQYFKAFRSPSGDSYYPRVSDIKTICIYDRLKRLEYYKNPLRDLYSANDFVVRIESRFVGTGVPFPYFFRLDRYQEIDFLKGITFYQLVKPLNELRPMERLRVVGLTALVEKLGLQLTSKQFSSSEWAYITKKYLTPCLSARFLNISALMRRSVTDWLEDRIRFPRAGKLE